ncbi:hypothetical protein C8J56DRAFT_1039701 [Mycena floridula]|nr:hypothetical protein C8J56DRAFT_1039701 [Mycena floridula]
MARLTAPHVIGAHRVPGSAARFVHEHRYLPPKAAPLPKGEVSPYDYINVTVGGEEAIYVCSEFLVQYTVAQAHDGLDSFTDIIVSQFNAVHPLNPHFNRAQRRVYDVRLAEVLIELLRDFQKWRKKEIKFELVQRRRVMSVSQHEPGLQSLFRQDEITLEAISALLAAEDRLNEQKDKVESICAADLEEERYNTRNAVMEEFGLDKLPDSSGEESDAEDAAEVEGSVVPTFSTSPCDFFQDDLGPASSDNETETIPSSQPDEDYYTVLAAPMAVCVNTGLAAPMAACVSPGRQVASTRTPAPELRRSPRERKPTTRFSSDSF